MVLAYIIYMLLPLLMILSLRKISNNIIHPKYQYINKYLLSYITIILVTIIIGYRYGVGSDYYSYEQMYLNQDKSFSDRYGLEFIFYTIYKICNKLDLSYNFALCILNIIPISFFYKTFKNNPVFVWIIIMWFLSGAFFIHLNIMRQSIALFIIIFSIRYIINRSFIKFLILIIIASGFHTSAILFLPTYYIYRLSWIISSRKIQYIIYFTTLILSTNILNIIIDYIFEIMQYTPYAQYGGLLTSYEIQKGSGAGVIIKKIADIVIIFYSPLLLNKYKQYGFVIFYLIYFVGIIIGNIFGLTSLLLIRITFLFESFRFIILGYLFHFLHSYKMAKHQMVFICLLSIYIIYYAGMIHMHNNLCSPFQFAF